MEVQLINGIEPSNIYQERVTVTVYLVTYDILYCTVYCFTL